MTMADSKKIKVTLAKGIARPRPQVDEPLGGSHRHAVHARHDQQGELPPPRD
jgi:hypothetical protein